MNYYILTNADGNTQGLLIDGENYLTDLIGLIMNDHGGDAVNLDTDTQNAKRLADIGEITAVVTDGDNTSTFTYYLSEVGLYARPEDLIKQAKATLTEAGYFADNLWHIEDVKTKFVCDDETAYGILEDVMTSESLMEDINIAIQWAGDNEGLTEIEE